MENKNDILNKLQPKEVQYPSEAFFEQLSQVATKHAPDKKQGFSIKQLIYVSTSIAALLIVGLMMFKHSDTPKSNTSIQLAEVETHEIEHFIHNQTPIDDTTKKIKPVVVDSLKIKTPDLLQKIPSSEINAYLNELELELSEEASTELYNL